MAVYKRTSTVKVEGMRYIPPSSHEPLEHSAHPIVTLVLHQYYSAGHRAITSKEGPEPG
jgi:hypothetical protein